MLRKIIFCYLFIQFGNNAFAQKNDTLYKLQWIDIDSNIIQKNLPKTALSKVNVLYEKSKQNQNQQQIIKCLIYKLSLEDVVFENKPNNAIVFLENEIATTKNEAAKSILYCLLANRYQNYFNSNRWRYYNRNKTNESKTNDIETWNADDFNEAITKNYLKSIENASLLQTINLDNYKSIIVKGNTRNLRPTLYDILMHDALDYFKTGNYYLTKPAYAFELNDINALSTSNEFVNHQFSSPDSSAQQLIALHLFQQLIKFHLNDTNQNALITVDIERVEWVYAHLKNEAKVAQYINTLQSIAKSSFKNAAQASYLLAKIEADKSSSYIPIVDTFNRYCKVNAMKIIDAALQKFKTESDGTINLKNLKTQIEEKKISTQIENVNIPNQPLRSLVNYKNVDTIFIKIFKINSAKEKSGFNNKELSFSDLLALKPYTTFSLKLPATNDYQNHNVEIKIDPLPVGEYVMISSVGAGFIDSLHEMCKHNFLVSNISYVKNGNDYFVLNRTTGKPLFDVQAKIYFQKWNSLQSKNITQLVATKKSDKDGRLTFLPNDESGYYIFHFKSKDDYLNLNNTEYIYRSSDYFDAKNDDKESRKKFEFDNASVFFFTDRSIYRPGQTLYFKGICITKDFLTNESKLYFPKDSIKVFLYDVNDDEVDSLSFKPNEYGSFSGTFKIPQNVLTGNFKIETEDFDNSSKSFSVEEYKRPKFYVDFEKISTDYKINDSVTIKGFAKAYAGNNIDNANVKYTVTRNTRFVYDWYWRNSYRPRSNQQIISTGTAVTDASGNFTITFKATADESVDKLTDPLFDYTIDAGVTDMNGETRNSNTKATLGYKRLLLNINVPSVAIADSTQQIVITTKNLNNEKQDANVVVKIFAVETPNRLIRKRYWEQPDQYVFSKQEYFQYFPNDDYADELNDKKWVADKLVYTANINTAENTNLLIPKATLTTGYYKVEAITKDKEGNEIKDIKYMQLFNQTAAPFPQFQFSYVVNNYVQPNETAEFLMGSMADDIYVIQQNTSNQYSYNSYSKGIHSIKYIVTENDRGNTAIDQVYIIHNRIYTNHYDIQVPWSNKQLQVNYTSFRNKTEPGSKETYTVNIQGNDGQKVAAELLTSMYDASLDQFKKQEWDVPGIWPNEHYNNNFSWSNNFFTQQSIASNFKNDKLLYSYTKYDALAKNINDLLKQSDYYLNVVLKRKDANLEEVVVINSYEATKKKALTGSVSGVTIRGMNSIKSDSKPLYIIDGVIGDSNFTNIAPDDINTIEVLKDATATAIYGTRAANGVIIVTTKAGAKKKEQEQVVKPRKNFNETAFFFPNLYADTSGNYTFSFTIPESLTQWKWLSFAHTKNLAFGTNSATITTQKTLMVQPNAPRFLREGDNLEFVAKIANLGNKELTGQCTLELLDATTGVSVDGWFQNSFPTQYFTANAQQSTTVKFPIQIPFNFNKPLTWRVIAKSGNYGDGEENIVPVLTNRMLVTESLPLYLKPGEKEKLFVFEKLLNNKSESLVHESVTVEYTSNPIWNVVQALPYLMEYPYECSEQTFNRMYANALAASIVNKNSTIKKVIDCWKNDTSMLKSNLQKNEDLKQVLLQETPWVLNAKTEQENQKNIALLFDLGKMSSNIDAVIEKLKQLQTINGGFAWFKGGNENRYITNYILIGIGKLKKINALTDDQIDKLETLVDKALEYLDIQTTNEYNWLKKNKIDLNKNNLFAAQIQYLYMKSFYADDTKKTEAYLYYYNQAKQYWNKQNTYNTALIGLTFYRNNETRFVNVNILPSILENAIEDTSKGTLYWKQRTTFFWYASPIEHQSLMIEFLNEVASKKILSDINNKIDAAKTWLILNKQTNNWQTTIATADACYALLNSGNNWINNNQQTQIKLGNQVIKNQTSAADNTDYIKQRIAGDKVNSNMGNITISQMNETSVQQSAPSFGSVYWQYFEDMDKITEALSPLSLKKKYFVEKKSNQGTVLESINTNDVLKVGDKIIVRIELKSDRTMEYLHLKDMRASGTEPVNVLSSYKWQDGLGYYEATKDASTNFFIDYLEKGTYVFEYPLYVTHSGKFSVGIASIQCMYAPEFTSHSEGIKIMVQEK
jgi:TonB-dependent SusC/RagA subfamily outer membrane receptor